MIRKREIDALLENFDWETNPDWEVKIYTIWVKIYAFWKEELKR